MHKNTYVYFVVLKCECDIVFVYTCKRFAHVWVNIEDVDDASSVVFDRKI